MMTDADLSMKPYKITALASGRGSNLHALLKAQDGYSIEAVISNREDAGALEIASSFKVPVIRALPRHAFTSLEAHKEGILKAVVESKPDLVVLAGFMMVLPPSFVEAFPGQILNIHPSLLPAFPGLNTHTRALNAGESEHGCTVHIVDTGVDTGPIIAQASVSILPSDTPEMLETRVLAREHELYPWIMKQVAMGTISLYPTLRISNEARNDAKSRGFRLPGIGY